MRNITKIIIYIALLVLFCSSFLIVKIDRHIRELENSFFESDLNVINDYELKYVQNILSSKTSLPVQLSSVKILYDFLDQPSYLFVYDSNINCYAVFHRCSGEMIELGHRQSDLLNIMDKKCYYGGISTFFYEKNNKIFYVSDLSISFTKVNAFNLFKDFSIDLNNNLFADGKFNSLAEMKTYMKNNQYNLVRLAAENRDNQVMANNLLYHIGIVEKIHIDQGRYCYYIKNNKTLHTGYTSFSRFGNNNEYSDIIFPYNYNGTCGTVAATALLQYYERNQIVRTVPDSFYENSFQNFFSNANITTVIQNVVSEKIHRSLNSRHSNGGSGSTYISIKNTLNKYFSDYQLDGVSAVCSAGTLSLANCINDGNPAIIFVSACTIYGSSWDDNSYTERSLGLAEGHAMYTYGYTTSDSGSIDEYICNAGWSDWGNGEYTWGVSFVSKSAIRGNVRIKIV